MASLELSTCVLSHPSIHPSIIYMCSVPSIHYLYVFCPIHPSFVLIRLSDLFEKYFIDWIAAADRPIDPSIIAPIETDE